MIISQYNLNVIHLRLHLGLLLPGGCTELETGIKLAFFMWPNITLTSSQSFSQPHSSKETHIQISISSTWFTSIYFVPLIQSTSLFLSFITHWSASFHVHMCTLQGQGSGPFPPLLGGLVWRSGCLCVVLHWSVPPYRTNTSTSATPLTVTQLTFRVPSLRLLNTLSHTHAWSFKPWTSALALTLRHRHAEVDT